VVEATACPDRLTVSLLQVASPPDEPKADRIERVRAWLMDLAPADLVVLPETWATGFDAIENCHSEAEPEDGPTVTMCRAVARQRGIHLAMGSFLARGPDGLIRNTALLLGPDGQVVHRYNKIHLFPKPSREAELLTPGDTISVAPLPWGGYATATCYDIRFPGLWLELGRRGADLVVLPAAWPVSRLEHWLALTKARAIESQIFLLACAATGLPDATGAMAGLGCGHSRVVDPFGRILGELGSEQAELRLTLDRSTIDQVRAKLPVRTSALPSYSTLSN